MPYEFIYGANHRSNLQGQTVKEAIKMPINYADAQNTQTDMMVDLFNRFLMQVMEQEIVVKPGDSDIVRLSILPLKPGLLRITGLEWVLNGQAQGKRLFAAKAPQHRRTGSR
jgi:hypothetical protein